MAPTSTAISGQLRQLVYYHLDNYSYDNALFYAERLTAHDPRSSESIYLLALSHFRLGDHRTACEYSKAVAYRGSHLGCAFVFAQSCLILERYKDGITALEKSRGLWTHKTSFGRHTATNRAPHPDAATIFCLLGKLYRLYEDKKKAILCFEESLKANPFIWDAFTALCDMGVNVRTPNIFKLNDSLLQGLEHDLPAGILSEQRDTGFVNPLEPVLRKPSRTAIYENMDPFDAHRAAAGNETFLTSNISSFNTAENEFMAKINAARSRMASGSVRMPDGLETPPTNNQDHPHVPRLGLAQEPTHGAPKKTRNVQANEPSDMPSKVGYRLGARRNQRPQEKVQDDFLPESDSASLRVPAPNGPGFERKRTVSGHPVQPRQQSEEPGAPPRRSTRINMFRGTSSKANSGAATVGGAATRELKKARPPISRIMRPATSSGTSVGRAVSGNRKPMDDGGMDVDHAEAPRFKEPPPPPPMVKAAEPEPVKVEEPLRYLLDLLKKFGAGYFALSQFQCSESIVGFNSLPKVHQETPWVLSQMGRAYYEQANYAEAEKQYRRLRILAPTRLEDMEVYSTILWFLKRETDLCFLAHDLVDSAWHSPQAWCALGNAWSLARDHEQALRCFKRATQLNPSFAYAFTLQGHEHVANEEYEKALTAYRQAISADRRHYNAYYGIGRVYEKLGNYDKAYTHFHTASVINPTNAVLICCIGNVLERQRQTVQALQYFSKATELAPNAAQTRYKKARALLALNQLDAAQRELEILKHLAPDEATVHFLLGKLYKSLNDKGAAVRHFTIALNLDPKASQQIKEAIESLEEEDSYEDSMMA
ncbi:anaphase-promoting complex subunit 3 [Apiospora kogelbergensis]|uniref:Anaphase-promoting complex subunit 3 n=1 Tax=Apiospora kogelbergensis TaxID=1337665 RepID=A0AAW0QVR0_9PEZI